MARTKKATPNPTSVLGYVRVSTAEQADSGLGLEAQRAAITSECARRGWTLLAIHEDAGASGKSFAGRPGMAAAMAALDRGEAAALVVAKLDRATRSVMDAASLLAKAQRNAWALVALDLGVDMTTPAGEAMANVMATFAQLERRLIGQRTREALAVKRSQGVQLGRPKTLNPATRERIIAAYKAGAGWSAIARELNADSVPTSQGGGRWWPSTVQAIVLAA